ncbi:ferritin-like domain-containing protein [Halobacillus litoralis]|uniref:ferritin-like domain-containing protein n=1 Tax=Halobacillus litoralis TaxID=45668 RepID=UPI001CFCBD05|nr:ferritin-like domain-containing protein [Halobacillus litoralis]WLR47637.1 ferritin-like domain-containing protein [Halobacillus litoralis]
MQDYRESFIQRLQRSIEEEWKDHDFYSRLKGDTSNRLFRDYIKHAENDELKHYQMFQHLHLQLTGKYHEFEPKTIDYRSFENGVIKAQQDEFKSAEMYREMLFMVPTPGAYHALFTAMTDEMEHATRFGTIYGRLN